MKWLEIVDPKKIKKRKIHMEELKTEQVDHFRLEYASLILFDEINQLKGKAIEESIAIKLFKSSATLLSPYRRFTSGDIKVNRLCNVNC
ncbi:hypothetical protein AHAS_Ahas06G0145500 [Arachis hypogaea]